MAAQSGVVKHMMRWRCLRVSVGLDYFLGFFNYIYANLISEI